MNKLKSIIKRILPLRKNEFYFEINKLQEMITYNQKALEKMINAISNSEETNKNEINKISKKLELYKQNFEVFKDNFEVINENIDLLKVKNNLTEQSFIKNNNHFVENIQTKYQKLIDMEISNQNINKAIDKRTEHIYYEIMKHDTAMYKTMPRQLLNIAVHLVDHCNLKCKGCDHFSSIADEYYLELESFENDCVRLGRLFHGIIGKMKLMGGEPLLHPEVNDFMRIARQNFRIGSIALVTNGLLLTKMDDDFWNTCKENNIEIEVTKYPISIDFERINQIALEKGVIFKFFGTSKDTDKTSYHIPFDITGEQDTRRNFINCFHANDCIMLQEGKIFTCTIAPNSKHFNKKFGTNMDLTEKDYIDIYQVKRGDEILEYLARPIPFCRYCNVKKRTFGHKWEISKGEISEWTVENQE